MDARPYIGVQKRPKTIKSDQNGRASSTVSSKSAQKRRAQFNILVPEPPWRYQEGRSAPKKGAKSAPKTCFSENENATYIKKIAAARFLAILGMTAKARRNQGARKSGLTGKNLPMAFCKSFG
jgi:hypothetical protein